MTAGRLDPPFTDAEGTLHDRWPGAGAEEAKVSRYFVQSSKRDEKVNVARLTSSKGL
jgi:hypothetical protein